MLQIVLAILMFFPAPVSTDVVSLRDEFMIQLNTLRSQGCQCGEKWMSGAPVTWNEKLELSATLHARQMQRFNFFEHFSRGGKDIGERTHAVGYQWRTVGENLAHGQRKISEVLRDWQKSDTHCAVMMNPNFGEMGVAKVGAYWVLHMGTRKK